MKLVKSVLEKFLIEVEEELGELEEKVDERLSFQIEDQLNELLFFISECETPIEKIFGISFFKVFDNSRLHFLSDIFECQTQQEITIDEKTTYRVDYLISFLREKNNVGYEFVIECDGHEFHEKTKEQASRDRKRERDLLEKGIIVIRFTGSEIYNNPHDCARQAMRIIEKYITQQYKM